MRSVPGSDGNTHTLISSAPGDMWYHLCNPNVRARFRVDGVLIVEKSDEVESRVQPDMAVTDDQGNKSDSLDGSEGDGDDESPPDEQPAVAVMQDFLGELRKSTNPAQTHKLSCRCSQ